MSIIALVVPAVVVLIPSALIDRPEDWDSLQAAAGDMWEVDDIEPDSDDGMDYFGVDGGVIIVPSGTWITSAFPRTGGPDVPELRCKILVGHKDLEAFVCEIYPHLAGYSFVISERCRHGTAHEFEVYGRLDAFQVADWAAGRLSNYLLLDKLCADGHIRPGSYIIMVARRPRGES